MPHHLNEEDLRRHRQLAANSWFPYRKALDDSEGKPLPVSHIDTTVLRAVTEHLHDDDRLTLIGEHLLNSDGYQQPANKDWVSRSLRLLWLQRDVKRAGGSGTKTL